MDSSNKKYTSCGIRVVQFGAAFFSVALLSLARGQSPSAAEQANNTSTPVEVFEGPRIKKLSATSFANPNRSSRADIAIPTGKEGWVNVNMMIDAKGRPFEPTVVDSFGDRALEKAAIQYLSNTRFEAASLNGKPVDSATTMKITFSARKGARPEYVEKFSALQYAVNKKDKAAAESAFQALEPINLHEDAYYGFAQYLYAINWGDTGQQLAGLKRAIAYESRPTFLSKDTFAFAMLAMLPLQVEVRDFGGALLTWKSIQESDIDEGAKARIAPTIDKLQKFRTDERSYSVDGRIDRISWNMALFKKRFRFKVTDGHIAEIKLRCERKFVFFRFDAAMEYQVADSAGECSIEAIGDPGTKFEFIQS